MGHHLFISYLLQMTTHEGSEIVFSDLTINKPLTIAGYYQFCDVLNVGVLSIL